tara:strand:+ start:1697 stop:2812 length:1116 start_codon:yes stop_codon:yes gene_type:complete
MKKLIFRKFAIDTINFFVLLCLTLGIIVWTIQAVKYFDFVTQDGHGLQIYFSYIIFNFPKIIHRIIPFIFFISIFYILVNYEARNELSIFWTNGVSKIEFANKIIFLSIILTILQILIGSYFSPVSQYKSRQFLKNSNIDFFTSLLNEGKFINAVKGLTIFIEEKNTDETFLNIFIDDSTKSVSRMIYAKKGELFEDKKIKILRLYDGKVINNEKPKINIFEFDQIDFNLTNYSTKTILTPKIQELPSTQLIKCAYDFIDPYIKEDIKNFKCDESIVKEINQELLKRFYKPLYIPMLAILCSFLLIIPKNNILYNRNRNIIFLLTFLVLIISEGSLRYSTVSNFTMTLYLLLPWIAFSLTYFIFKLKSSNV